MSKFKLTQTAAEVQGILNNSLQKPTGLTKTKLVGVGVNGQENIEIGDNLTLANGKLSAAAGGVNGLKSDAEGNLTASKNLGVDGKLTLKSLVSASNPDGDITKELGGGGGGTPRHGYSIIVDGNCHYNIYTTKNYNLPLATLTYISDFATNDNYKELRSNGQYPASGMHKVLGSQILIVNLIKITNTAFYVDGYDIDSKQALSDSISDPNFQIVQLY